MTNTIPPSTRIRRSRVGNVDTDRLVARQVHIATMAVAGFAECTTRRPFVDRALELHAIENEMDRRGAIFARRTLTTDQIAGMTCA